MSSKDGQRHNRRRGQKSRGELKSPPRKPSEPAKRQKSVAQNSSDKLSSSFSLREFIYLDFPKITSYLAQIESGLVSQKGSSRSQGNSHISKKPDGSDMTSQETFEVAGEATLSSEDKFAKKITDLVEGIKDTVDAKLREISTVSMRAAVTENSNSDASTFFETQILHHEAFTRLHSYIRDYGLLSSSLASRTGTFYEVSGRIAIVDMPYLKGSLINWDTFAKHMNAVTGNPIASIQNSADLAWILNRFYGEKTAIILYSNGMSASTILQDEHLTSPLSHIIDNYGRFTTVKITIFGIRVEDSGQFDIDKSNKSFGELSAQLIKATESLENIEKTARLRGNLHLFPIAIYMDISQVG